MLLYLTCIEFVEADKQVIFFVWNVFVLQCTTNQRNLIN